MRLAAAVFTFVCLSACSTAPSPTSSEQSLVPQSYDEWRQGQAMQDANVIMQGMAQAREREDELARSGR